MVLGQGEPVPHRVGEHFVKHKYLLYTLPVANQPLTIAQTMAFAFSPLYGTSFDSIA